MASKEFSHKLKMLRQQAGYSQKQVYEHFHIPQSTFSSWEIGKSEPSGKMLLELYNFYGYDIKKDASGFKSTPITQGEFQILGKYRTLDLHGKEMVDFTLDKEYERCISTASHTDIIPLPFVSNQATVNAAHAIVNPKPEDILHDEAIMDDDTF